MHELGHLFGLMHEHQRSDRDNYIQINWQAVKPGMEHAFHLLGRGEENHGPYDFLSIMHYDSSAYSRDEYSLDTISPLSQHANYKYSMGRTFVISEGDAQFMRDLYGAPGAQTTTSNINLRVIDLETRAPVSGAEVQIVGGFGVRTYRADGSGSISTGQIPRGEYTVVVIVPSYVTHASFLELRSDMSQEIPIMTDRSPPSQESANLSLVIRNRVTRVGVPGAIITIDGRSETTDGNGFVNFGMVPHKNYLVDIRANGYIQQRITVYVNEDINESLNISPNP
ncbi:MAG: M12 family metallopeptidase [Bdellovibrionales bacterium]